MPTAKNKRNKYTSKGERHNTNPSVDRAKKRDRSLVDILLIKQRSWEKGENPWVTVDNPNPHETNKRKIRVRARQLWGDPKEFVTVLGRAQ